MGNRRYREFKTLAGSADGRLVVPGAGPAGTDYVIRPSIPPLYTSGWMSDADNFPPRPQGGVDVGCQMQAFKTHYASNGSGPFKVTGLARYYEGPLRTLQWTQGSFLYGGATAASFSHPDSLLASGTTAIARTIPTHPVAGAAVALAELRREGIPRVPTAATVRLALEQKKLLERGFRNRTAGKVRPRDLGDEYLNYEFGWRPIVSDLRKFARSIKDAHSIVDQMHRDSGQNVRRRYDFPVSNTRETSFDEPNTSRTPAMSGDLGNLDSWMMGSGPAQFKVDIEYTSKRWFAGCYTFYVPPADATGFDKARLYEQYANQILGTRLTPEVVWNLAPWSWAADWFSNLGDVATNFSYFGADGLAMRYGYVMEKNTSTIHASWSGRVNLAGSPNTQISLNESFGSQTMTRRYASPYGFGLTFDGFTPRQQAITVALGLTRGDRN